MIRHQHKMTSWAFCPRRGQLLPTW